MAATVVAGLIPTLHSVASDKSSYYFGRQLWFGFIAMYGLVVYMVYPPWVSIPKHFGCHGNINDTCLTECFEDHVSIPVIGMWYIFFIVFLAYFFLLEVIMAQVRLMKIRVKTVAIRKRKMEMNSKAAIVVQDPSPRKPFVNQRRIPLVMCLYFLLQMTFQCVFSYLLLYKQQPLVTQSTIHCSTLHCPGPFICMFRGTMEKQMPLYSLLSLSFMITLFCWGFLIYSIRNYFFRGQTNMKVAVD